MDCPGTKTMGLTQKLHRKKKNNPGKIFWCATPLKIIKETKKRKGNPEAKLIEGCPQNSGEDTTEND